MNTKEKGIFFPCLKAWLFSGMRTVIFYAVSILILAFIFFLYDTGIEPVLYAFSICAVIGVIIAVSGFSRFYALHRDLIRAAGDVDTAADSIPRINRLIDSDYRRIILLLNKSRNDILDSSDSRRRSMQDYYAMWIHQIKVPISAMHLLMSDQEKNSPLNIELFKIEQYVQMALSYARLSSDHTDYVIKKHDLEDLVKQAVRKYAPLFIAKKIRLDISSIDMDVITDEKWIVFVIEQILSNSLKYTNTGSISIYTESPSSLVIEDTGIGIAPEDIERLGERGFTGYNGRLDKRSTGLGLYLCKEILSDLSHGIEITSELSKGTKVRIDFSRPDITFE